MFKVVETAMFADWLQGLRDVSARARIVARIRRAQGGHLGDVKYFDGIGEMRIDHGPGYRLYFVQRGAELVILLCGGDKRRQAADIAKAKRMAKDL
ncbi:type II toxin-antitoxin system RelE/ParE family toxin [Bosea sp. (in: a-proteobacteria)]|uniref:type II toxin-antitoxin system RelE/ParE family toxin n=1 Tax=Bosea sp. (in: a-proteobacteria) TaxID=1871050 RepID=UPI0027353782|nr:type II toxin-antitoxin system RelE/ParE family toxin [Bosea sp. (in: a-proteobacteria)]MDP3409301.1 type II toxin-antitoxin system RelE/ParE family toxin [Bosea sp. (in: a-proteobacteria)]